MIDDNCGAISGMRIGRGNRSSWTKPAPVPFCPPQIPHDQTRATNRMSYGVAYFLDLNLMNSRLYVVHVTASRTYERKEKKRVKNGKVKTRKEK
jgi:hypothetical protein